MIVPSCYKYYAGYLVFIKLQLYSSGNMQNEHVYQHTIMGNIYTFGRNFILLLVVKEAVVVAIPTTTLKHENISNNENYFACN